MSHCLPPLYSLLLHMYVPTASLVIALQRIAESPKKRWHQQTFP